MKIEEGKFYRTRSGEKRGPMKRVRHAMYPWNCDHPFLGEYTENGRFYFNSEAEDREDLVAEWSEPVLSGPAVELSTLADMDAQPGDIVGLLNTETPHGTPVCRVFKVLANQHLQRTETGAAHDFTFAWATRPLFFMIHRAPRDAGSIDTSPSEFWKTAYEEITEQPPQGFRIDSSADVTYETRAASEEPEPNPDHEAENSRDALLDGPDWRGHCRALLRVVDSLVSADSNSHRALIVVRNAQHIGAAQRDLEAGQ